MKLGPLLLAGLLAIGCATGTHSPPVTSNSRNPIVAAARDQLSWGTRYDPAYIRLSYPGGDLPHDRGVCTDVVIRALRPTGFDLQRLVHEDILNHPAAYPRVKRPDANIDHRRVPNLAVFFTRHHAALSSTDWRPGDIVWWKLNNGRDHIGVLSDRRGPSGDYCVIHNLATTAEEDCLRSWKIVGHYRYPNR